MANRNDWLYALTIAFIVGMFLIFMKFMVLENRISNLEEPLHLDEFEHLDSSKCINVSKEIAPCEFSESGCQPEETYVIKVYDKDNQT